MTEVEQSARGDLLVEAIRRAGWMVHRIDYYPRAGQSTMEMWGSHARELVAFVARHTTENIHWQLTEDEHRMDFITVGCSEAECLVVVSALSHCRLRGPRYPAGAPQPCPACGVGMVTPCDACHGSGIIPDIE